MPSPRGFSLLLTASQSATRLGVSIHTFLGCVAAGRLKIAGQDEDGRPLFREGVVEALGEHLAALGSPGCLPISEHANLCLITPLNCGCDLSQSPPSLCRTGASLYAAAILAEQFVTSAPNDDFLAHIASLCRDAISRHFGEPLGAVRRPELQPTNVGEMS